MKLLIFILIALQSTTPEIGKKISDDIEYSRYDVILVPSNRSYPAIEIISNGIEYTLGVDTNRIVKYIDTSDPKFETNGYSVKTKFCQLPDSLKNKLVRNPGYVHFIELESEWIIGFITGPNATNRDVIDSDTISYFYKISDTY